MTEVNDAAASEAAIAWLRVCDDLLGGLSHALNNRMAAVGSIARVLEYGGQDPLHATLAEEIAKLEDVVALLRLVPASSAPAAELVRLEDLIPDVLQLHSMRADVADLTFQFEIGVGAAPVYADPGTLTRALLLVLGAMSTSARELGATSVTLRLTGDTDWVTLEFAVAEGRGESKSAAAVMNLRAADGLLRVGGGELSFDGKNEVGGRGPTVQIRLRIPSR